MTSLKPNGLKTILRPMNPEGQESRPRTQSAALLCPTTQAPTGTAPRRAGSRAWLTQRCLLSHKQWLRLVVSWGSQLVSGSELHGVPALRGGARCLQSFAKGQSQGHHMDPCAELD